MFRKVGKNNSLFIRRIFWSKMEIKTIGIIGVSAKPKTLNKILKLRKSALPLLAKTVPNSAKMIRIVKIME